MSDDPFFMNFSNNLPHVRDRFSHKVDRDNLLAFRNSPSKQEIENWRVERQKSMRIQRESTQSVERQVHDKKDILS